LLCANLHQRDCPCMTVKDREHIYNIRSKFENFQLLTSLKVFMLRNSLVEIQCLLKAVLWQIG